MIHLGPTFSRVLVLKITCFEQTSEQARLYFPFLVTYLFWLLRLDIPRFFRVLITSHASGQGANPFLLDSKKVTGDAPRKRKGRLWRSRRGSRDPKGMEPCGVWWGGLGGVGWGGGGWGGVGGCFSVVSGRVKGAKMGKRQTFWAMFGLFVFFWLVFGRCLCFYIELSVGSQEDPELEAVFFAPKAFASDTVDDQIHFAPASSTYTALYTMRFQWRFFWGFARVRGPHNSPMCLAVK